MTSQSESLETTPIREEQPAPAPAPQTVAVPAGAADVQRFADGKPMVDVQGRPASPKSRLAALLLAWFIGAFGVHRFYVGKVGTGILMIVATIFTLGIAGIIWALIDLIVIAVGSFKDKEGRFLSNW